MLYIRIEHYGPHGWEWEHHYYDITGHEEHGRCRTDEDGKGLWVWDESNETYLQLRAYMYVGFQTIDPTVDAWLEDYNRRHPLNKFDIIELRTDQKYGKFLVHQPAQAAVTVKRENGKIVVEIEDFLSPTIVERLEMDMPLFKATITDWRAMVDCVMIDTAYNGDVFNIVLSDVPERKHDLVVGRYELDAPEGDTTVAVKIIDMLGEEVLANFTI